MNLAGINFVGCHRLPHRSFFIGGRQFPVCARCTGMLIGYLSFPLFLLGVLPVPLAWSTVVWSVFLNVPAMIDGLTQAYCERESNNTLRVITGFLSGVGQMLWVSIIGKFLGTFVVNLLKN